MTPDDATHLLLHYFELLAHAARIPWDSDNRAEVGDIVNYILSEPRHEIVKLNAEVTALRTAVTALEKSVRILSCF